MQPLTFGSSSFCADGWVGSFYPEKTPPRDHLRLYGQQFKSVEVESTFYRTPSPSTVERWYEDSPDHFIFAAKAPQVITHDKCMGDCDEELYLFAEAMSGLREKLGPLLLQFPYFNKKVFATAEPWLARLHEFLPKLPKKIRWAVEIRNKTWLNERLFGLLREHRVALAWIDHPWMPRPAQMLAMNGSLTTDFLYTRLLGDRYAIEEVTKTWNKAVVDRSREIDEWAGVVQAVRKAVPVYTYASNYFAGHAPDTIRKLMERIEKRTPKA